jgi:hypothetical protein
VAVAVVAALGLAAWMLFSSTGDEPEPTSSPQPSFTLSSPTPTDTPSPSDSASPKPSKSPTATPTKSSSPKPTKTTSPKPSNQPVPTVGVYVFNQTRVTGLAAAFGAELTAAGWNVLGVGNWVGRVPENTVYYWPGDRAAAERLDADFPQVTRVWPASSPMPGDGLSVIFASDPQK